MFLNVNFKFYHKDHGLIKYFLENYWIHSDMRDIIYSFSFDLYINSFIYYVSKDSIVELLFLKVVARWQCCILCVIFLDFTTKGPNIKDGTSYQPIYHIDVSEYQNYFEKSKVQHLFSFFLVLYYHRIDYYQHVRGKNKKLRKNVGQ